MPSPAFREKVKTRTKKRPECRDLSKDEMADFIGEIF